MSEVVENEVEEFGLDDLIEAEEKERADEALEAEQPSQSELERAQAFAEKLNAGFLFGVSKFVCPSVESIDEVIDREAGTEALTPLAMEMGGTMPPWMAEFLAKYDPYIKAGVYMGMTVYTASQIEKQLQAQAEEAEQGGNDGG